MVLVCGFGLYILFQSKTHVKWVKAVPPPEPLVLLKAGGNEAILAQSEAGNLYKFSFYPNYDWEKVSELSVNPPDMKNCAQGDDNAVNPPGKVKSRVSVSCVYAELRYHSELALLESGEVWYLEGADNSYADIGRGLVSVLIPIACVPGALLIALGLVLLFVQMMKKKQTA
jgi:hypothetical protein